MNYPVGVRAADVQGAGHGIDATLEQQPGSASSREAVVQCHELTRRFGAGAGAVDALSGVSVAFERGTFTAIMGPSGSGKSTLMHILAGLDKPT